MSDCYTELDRPAMRAHRPGQFFWVPGPMLTDRVLAIRLGFLKEGQDITQAPLRIERLRPEDIGRPTEAEKVEFHKRMPIPEINLSASEDLLIQKVKIRPAVLLFKSGINMRRFSQLAAGLTSKPVNPNHCVFAPVYSLRKDENLSTDYPDAFIEKLKNGDYPNLLHLPAYKSHLPNESMLVLDDLFGVGIHAFRESPLCIEPLELASKIEVFFEFFQGEILLQPEDG